MLIILPDTENGLPGVLGSQTSKMENFESVLKTTKYRQAFVDLGHPAISITGSTLDLENVLTSMGLASIFRLGKADLSGMDGSHNTYISNIIHKALIDVSHFIHGFGHQFLNCEVGLPTNLVIG